MKVCIYIATILGLAGIVYIGIQIKKLLASMIVEKYIMSDYWKTTTGNPADVNKDAHELKCQAIKVALECFSFFDLLSRLKFAPIDRIRLWKDLIKK